MNQMVSVGYGRDALSGDWVAAELPPLSGGAPASATVHLDLGDAHWEQLGKITRNVQENLAAVMLVAARELCGYYAPTERPVGILVALAEGNAARFALHAGSLPAREASVSSCIAASRAALLQHLPYAATGLQALVGAGNGNAFDGAFPLVVAVGDAAAALAKGVVIALDPQKAGRLSLRAHGGSYPQAYCRTLLADYRAVLSHLVMRVHEPIGQAVVCSGESAERALEFGRGKQVPFAINKRLETLLEEQAAQRPQATAALEGSQHVSYAQLNDMANRVAAELRMRGIQPGSFVAVSMPRGVGALAAIYGILKAGAAYVPIDPAYPVKRQLYIATDSAAALVLTGAGESALAGHNIPMLEVSAQLLTIGAAPNLVSGADATGAAYMIYTSGSTGNPKGVVVEHRSVFNRIEWMQNEYCLGQGHVILQKTPISFDVSVWELFWWAYAGATVSLLPPGGEKHPPTIAETVRAHAVTHLHFVPSMLDAFLNFWEQSGDTALASLQIAFTSGEALTKHQAATFLRVVAPTGGARLVNLYGPTEATVDVTYFEVVAGQAGASVPIGRPIQNTQIYIVDDKDRLVSPGVAGELLIGGVNLARGYHGQPELTAIKFQDLPAPIAQRIYRTGDVARWTSDGLIEYLGRTDHQVKIRGYRIELGEIEEALRSCSGILDVRVLATSRADGTKVLAAYVLERSAGSMQRVQLREELGRLLPEHMVPAHVVVVDHFPLTPNGKLDRARLPDVFSAREVDSLIAAKDDTEAALLEIWKAVLGIDQIGTADNFFALGGDSISSLAVISKAKTKGWELSFQDVFRYPTIAELADHARRSDPAHEQPYERFSLLAQTDRERVPSHVEDAYPLSKLQAGLIFQNEIIRGASWYHDIQTFTIEAAFNGVAFRVALDRMTAQHPIFRTSYHLAEYSEFIQMVHPTATAPLFVEDWRDVPDDEQRQRVLAFYREESHRTFEWGKPGLVRVYIHILADRRFNYNLSFHDSALDGWSINQLHTRLLRYYHEECEGARIVENLDDRFLRKYVALEAASLVDAAARNYWNAVLSDFEATELPSLAPASAGQDKFEIAFWDVGVPPALSARLKSLAAELAVPVKCMLLAVHLRVLGNLAGKRHVITGYEHSGRPEEPGAEQAIGLFLNTLPLRFNLEPGETWAGLVTRVRDAETAFLPYRRYPMAAMKTFAGVTGPLFQAVFNFTHFHSLKALKLLPGMEDMEFNLKAETEFPLRAEFFQDAYSDDINLSLHYHAAYFSTVQMANIGGHYLTALEQLASEPASNYLDGSLLDVNELRTIESMECGPEFVLPGQSAMYDVLRTCERSSSTPLLRDNATILDGATVLARVSGLSGLLGLAQRRQQVIAIAIPRSTDWICAMVAVMGAGAIYLPIDPQQPDARIRTILVEAGARVLLCGPESANRFHDMCLELPCDVAPLVPGASAEAASFAGTPGGWDEVAYVLFTSGSTGTPKGALVEHSGMTNHLLAKIEELKLTGNDVIAQTAPATFDVSVWQALIGLACGAATVVYSADEQLSADSFVDQLERDRVTILEIVPSYFSMLLEHLEVTRPPLDDLRALVLTGEGLRHQLVRRWFSLYPGIRLVNAYGPTECSDDVSHHSLECTPSAHIVPIGRPIINTRLHVLDEADGRVPIGTPGQLCVTGVCVGRGYVNSPEKTSAAFAMRHPLGAWSSGRLYRTGDVARWREDGTLEFLGRRDEQVKVRGMRLELGEIENALLRIAEITNASVVCEPAAQRLTGFYVGTADPRWASSQLAATLPPHMLPERLIRLDELPTSAAGKVNKKALLVLAARQEATQTVEPPITVTERELAAQWAAALKVEASIIGRESDFFALGGTSLTAMAVAMRSNGLFNVADVFAARTLAKLAQRLDDGQASESAPTRILTHNRAKAAVVCFSYAGGQAVNFDAMAKQLDQSDRLALVGIDYLRPGTPAGIVPVEDLARNVLAQLRQLPFERYIIWGHCSGAAAALALAHAATDGDVSVSAVVLGGKLLRTDNAIQSQIAETRHWDDEAVVSWLGEASGMDIGFAFDSAMRSDLARAFRHDAIAANTFLARLWAGDTPKLRMPVHCVLAKDDPLTIGSEDLVVNWRLVAESLHVHSVEDGGHYFVQTRAPWAAALAESLAHADADALQRDVDMIS